MGRREVATSAEEAGEPFVPATQDMQRDGGETAGAEWVFHRLVDYDKKSVLFHVRWGRIRGRR